MDAIEKEKVEPLTEFRQAERLSAGDAVFAVLKKLIITPPQIGCDDL